MNATPATFAILRLIDENVFWPVVTRMGRTIKDGVFDSLIFQAYG